MVKRTTVAVLMGTALAASAWAQSTPATGLKDATHEITVTSGDTVYTGKVALKVDGGKVTGDMLITSPTEITGKVAGTSRDGVLMLDFPYHMTENMCHGTVKMKISMPAKSDVAKGTMEAKGCSDDPSQALPGTVELKPIGAKPAK